MQLLDEKQTTVYKRALDVSYNLKLQVCRFSSSCYIHSTFELRCWLTAHPSCCFRHPRELVTHVTVCTAKHNQKWASHDSKRHKLQQAPPYVVETPAHCVSLGMTAQSCPFQASRRVFKEINAKFPALPFTFRELETEKASSHRMGIKECLDHGLLHPYPVLYEKSGDLVAQFKATVLLMPNGSDR